MRKSFLLLSLLLAGCQPGHQAAEPPKRYQGDNATVIKFTSVVPACVDDSLPGVMIQACVRNGVITMPNPCAWPGGDPYAQLMCHELGHVNLWPANHPS